MAAANPNVNAWGGRTARRDVWWVGPLVTFVVLAGFVVYATFRVFEGSFYVADSAVVGYHYATPFGNPDLTFLVPQTFRDAIPLLTPAALILPAPAGFRLTCYYYRKAYYRSFAGLPPGCAVQGTTNENYKGERRLLLFQNLHRYFLYLALIVLVFNLYDAGRSILTPHGTYFGVGSAIMIVNVILLSGYTLGCHSFRHLVGGRLDCFSCDAKAAFRYGLWSKVTVLNGRHMTWAWASLVWVAFTDYYIRWVATTGTTSIFGVPV